MVSFLSGSRSVCPLCNLGLRRGRLSDAGKTVEGGEGSGSREQLTLKLLEAPLEAAIDNVIADAGNGSGDQA